MNSETERKKCLLSTEGFVVINVEQIKVNIHIPRDEVRIVAMQPYIRFDKAVKEPFKWADHMVELQLTGIQRSLNIAQHSFDGRGANFTVFPEYSIPGIAGVEIINRQISANTWPNESVIIAGIHGLSQPEYYDLCNMLHARVSQPNMPNSVPPDQWVNCCVIWIKDESGAILKYVQPKVRPAWPELNVTYYDMFNGTTIYVFEAQYHPSGYPCRFIIFICFDWVASVSGTTICDEVLDSLNKSWNGEPKPLHWVFVIQHNPDPNHPSFLNSTYKFLSDTNSYPFVERDQAIILHANTAVSPIPSKKGQRGYTACVFSPNAQLSCEGCRPTICMQPNRLRGNDILRRCKDIVFREMGECIHVFTLRVPRFVTPDVIDRTLPIPLAHVYAVHDSNDVRLCGSSIPAAVKWINDSLDTVTYISKTALNETIFKESAAGIESKIISDIRKSEGYRASNYVNWATSSFSNGKMYRDENQLKDVDLWGEYEEKALQHILHSLTSLGLVYKLEIIDAILHCALYDDEGFIQVIAILGDTYEDCRIHYDRFIPKSKIDPVLVVARDRDNLTATPKEFLRIDEGNSEHSLKFVDFQTLISICRGSEDSISLKGVLDGFISKNRRII
jgi:hypothetical protein